MIDVNAYIGPYPFRHIPHPEPGILVGVLEREGLNGAWVGHLPSAFYRDPSPGNDELFAALAPHADRLHPAPCIRPDWPDWERSLATAIDRGARAIRAYPPQWGLGPDDPSMRALCAACGEAGAALVLTARFEDLRQRHWMDQAGDLSAAAVRAVARGNRTTRIVVCSAGRSTIEEVHWGLTPDERELVFWDISWIWGPPEDELALLLRTMGSHRLVYGTAWPLRLAQTPRANLVLLPDELLNPALADPSRW
jgi:predicted TIM-barrel fold metal-dependent hydrolase